jgi:hypothetical protein
MAWASVAGLLHRPAGARPFLITRDAGSRSIIRRLQRSHREVEKDMAFGEAGAGTVSVEAVPIQPDAAGPVLGPPLGPNQGGTAGRGKFAEALHSVTDSHSAKPEAGSKGKHAKEKSDVAGLVNNLAASLLLAPAVAIPQAAESVGKGIETLVDGAAKVAAKAIGEAGASGKAGAPAGNTSLTGESGKAAGPQTAAPAPVLKRLDKGGPADGVKALTAGKAWLSLASADGPSPSGKENGPQSPGGARDNDSNVVSTPQRTKERAQNSVAEDAKPGAEVAPATDIKPVLASDHRAATDEAQVSRVTNVSAWVVPALTAKGHLPAPIAHRDPAVPVIAEETGPEKVGPAPAGAQAFRETVTDKQAETLTSSLAPATEIVGARVILAGAGAARRPAPEIAAKAGTAGERPAATEKDTPHTAPDTANSGPPLAAPESSGIQAAVVSREALPQVHLVPRPEDKAPQTQSKPGVVNQGQSSDASASPQKHDKPEANGGSVPVDHAGPSTLSAAARVATQAGPAAQVPDTASATAPAALGAVQDRGQTSSAPAVATNVASETRELPDAPQAWSNPVQAVHLAERLGQAEMRVGLRSDAFGNVQLHTVVRESQVGLSVGSERGDLRGFLASEIPALENSLRQHDLRFDPVRFLGNGTPAGDSRGSGDPGRQSFSQGRFFSHQFSGRENGPGENHEVEAPVLDRWGLSIHA